MHLTITKDENGVPVLSKAKKAIAAIESDGSGGYAAIGPRTKKGDRAYGKYQVMGNNIPSWTKEALGKSMTAKEFLADPQAQEKVFEHVFGGYVQKYGPDGAAAKWFSGSPNINSQASDGGNTVSQYVNKFSAGMGDTQSGLQTPQFGAERPKPIGDVVNFPGVVDKGLGLARPLVLGPTIPTFPGFGMGGGKVNLRDQNSVNQSLIARGEPPGSVAAAPPVQNAVPMQRSETKLPAPKLNWTADKAATALGLQQRVANAARNPKLQKMLGEWQKVMGATKDPAAKRQYMAKLSEILKGAGY